MNNQFARFPILIFICFITIIVSCTSPEKAFDSIYYDITDNQALVGEDLQYENTTFSVNSAGLIAQHGSYYCEEGTISRVKLHIECSKNSENNCTYSLDPQVTHQSGKTWGLYYRQTQYSTSVDLSPGAYTNITFASGFKTDSFDPLTPAGVCFKIDNPPIIITIGIEDNDGHEGKLEFLLTE